MWRVLPSWARLSFNAWEAKYLIGGQKFVVVMTILIQLYLFLNPKPPAISQIPFLVKKTPIVLSNTEKITQLIGEETQYSFAHFQRMVDKEWFVVICCDKGAKLPWIRFFTAPKVNFRFLKNFIQVCTIGCNMCYKCGEALRSR